MPDQPSEEVTRILRAARDPEAAREELSPLIYQHLRAIAAQRMAGEPAGHTLQPTALVHEAYARLVGGPALSGEQRGCFFAAASEAMRRVLIDHARKRRSQKRGGGRARLPLDLVDLADAQDLDAIVDLDAALTQLATEDPRAARVVELSFYGGLGTEEVADALGISVRTVRRELAFARARLLQLLEAGE